MRRIALAPLAAAFALSCSSPPKTTTHPTPRDDTDTPTPVLKSEPVAAKPTLDARRKQLSDLLADKWEYDLKRHPELASIIGDHRYDDQWSDASAEAQQQELADDADWLAKFQAIDTTDFPEQELLNQQLMVRDLQETLDNAKFEDWLMPVNQMSGPQLQLAQFPSMLRFATTQDYDNYLTRLEKVPEVFDQITALMRDGMAKGLMPPKEQLELTVPQTENLAKGKAIDSPFAQPILKFPDAVSADDQARLKKAILDAIDQKIFPTYVKFAKFLKDEYVPNGRKDPGLWALPDGDARYAAAIKQMTTTDMTADEIHDLGVKEVARIEGEQEKIGKSLGFKNLAAFKKHIRKDKKLYAKSKQDILDRYQKYVDQMTEKLPDLFGRLPQEKVTIMATEGFREKDASGAEYQEGTPDGSRPGRIQVNTYQPTKRLWIDMESTAYHEGVPGHHLQISIAHELPELPPFRQFGNYTAFAEGWALYSEQLGKDVGFYTDPYSDYGRLQDELLRAIRLVVDTGLHAQKWTRAQVVKYFHDHSTEDEQTVQSETNRYIVWPGQALAYKIGELTIMRLRGEAQDKLGDRFDIKAFHDFVLGAGALPMDVLEARFDVWLAGQS